MPQTPLSKLFQNQIFLISVASFIVISILSGVYFYNSNQNKLANSQQNSSPNSVSFSSNSFQNSQSFSSISVSNSQNSLTNSQNSSLICENLNRPNHDNWKKVVPENGCPYLEIGSEFSSKKFNSTETNSANSSQKINNSQNNFNSVSNSILSTNSSNSQTYINPNYPNLKINYDNSWKIDSKILSNSDDKSQTENIILTKNSSKLQLSFKVLSSFGCSPKSVQKPILQVGNKFRYQTENGKYVYNSETISESDCLNFVDKKILSSFQKDKFIMAENDGKNVFVWSLINLESVNPSEIKEADEIIKNSILE